MQATWGQWLACGHRLCIQAAHTPHAHSDRAARRPEPLNAGARRESHTVAPAGLGPPRPGGVGLPSGHGRVLLGRRLLPPRPAEQREPVGMGRRAVRRPQPRSAQPRVPGSWRLFGFDSAPWYWTSLLTHLFNVGLLFSVLRSLTGSAGLACLGASVWGMCPLAVATIGWYAVYGQAMVATFLLLVLTGVGRLAESGAPWADGRRGPGTRFCLPARCASAPASVWPWSFRRCSSCSSRPRGGNRAYDSPTWRCRW